jgi:hypothetical protein
MADERIGPQSMTATIGRPSVPEPVAASYGSDIPDEIYDLIDEVCPQDIAESGTVLACFHW